MPFRLINAPVIWQAFINNILQEYLNIFTIIYLDNILVYSGTEEEHIGYIIKVLIAIKKLTFKLK